MHGPLNVKITTEYRNYTACAITPETECIYRELGLDRMPSLLAQCVADECVEEH